MIERTFVMIKPDHIEHAKEILIGNLAYLCPMSLAGEVDSVPKEVIEEHYAIHRGKSFFGYMTASYIGRSVAIAVYEGDGAVGKFRERAGPTDPSKAHWTTIRGWYSRDSLDDAITERRPVKNVIHTSESPEEAEREIAIWTPYLHSATEEFMWQNGKLLFSKYLKANRQDAR